MAYGDRELGRGDDGPDVVELQMRLAGFRGSAPDGGYGPGTELQVVTFQRDWMKMAQPHGKADRPTLDAIADFGAKHPVDFAQLRCVCGACAGFGSGKFRNVYKPGPKLEVFYEYEYPGIHRMLLWTYRAAMLYGEAKGWKLTINSGYRCSEDNKKNKRTSTNHHGKAIDIDIVNAPSKMADMQRCNELRGIMVERANAQIGWGAGNRKALEPADIAPTWVHLDVRNYDQRYLDDRYFVTKAAELDQAPA
jgi:hypothetical protein